MTEKDYINVIEMLNNEAFVSRFVDCNEEQYQLLCKAVQNIAKAGIAGGCKGSFFYDNAENNEDING